jgi:hypothetical protein
MYPNWAAPIRVPFVVQCAGKLAKLMEDVQGGPEPIEVNQRLQKGFYYL